MSEDQTHANGADKANLPVEFTFEEHTLRTVLVDGEIRFVAADACAVLGIKNPTDAVDRLDEDEKALVCIEGIPGGQAVNVVNEFGLYNLILTSRKPQAKKFKRWVTHEVLPALRKTGRYEIGQDSDQASPEFAEHCRRRFHEIYAHDVVSPDYLLKILFDGNIPYTGDDRLRLLAKETCDALGIRDMEEALERLPPLAKGFVTVDAGGGPQRRPAITEAAVYVLAFTRRVDLSGPQLAAARDGVVHVPNVAGKYILTIPRDGQPLFYRVSESFLYKCGQHVNAHALRYNIKTIEAHLYRLWISILLEAIPNCRYCSRISNKPSKTP